MGRDLIIRYKDTAFNMGRFNGFNIEEGIDKQILNDNLDVIINTVEAQMCIYAAYNPKSIKELDDINKNIHILINNVILDAIKVGKTYIILELLEQGCKLDYSI